MVCSASEAIRIEEAGVKINNSTIGLRRVITTACGVAVLSLAVVAVQAQVPTIDTVANTPDGAIPTGMKVTCTANGNSLASTPTCPVIQYGSWTTWAFSYIDNRVSIGLVTYDSGGKVVKSTELKGTRYVYKITSDATAKTVTIFGQSNAKVSAPWSQMGPGPAPTGPGVYKWVTAAVPSARAVTAPDSPNAVVCRGQGPRGQIVGFWDANMCMGSFAGNMTKTVAPFSFLTMVSGAQQWVAGTGKTVPAEIGTVPSNTINAGTFDQNLTQIVCSQAGHIGWVYKNRCQVGWGPLTPAQNATVLVGTAQ